MEERIAVDVETAAEMLGISRAALYPLVMAGDVPSFKVGRRRLVPVDRLREWAASRSAGAESAVVAVAPRSGSSGRGARRATVRDTNTARW